MSDEIRITIEVNAKKDPADIGRAVIESIKAYEKRNGKGWRHA